MAQGKNLQKGTGPGFLAEDDRAVAHHDLSQLVIPGPDILHQHLEGGELELGGQWVKLLLLHFLQLHPVTQLPHELDPQPGLTRKRKQPQLWHPGLSQHKSSGYTVLFSVPGQESMSYPVCVSQVVKLGQWLLYLWLILPQLLQHLGPDV